MNRKLEQLAHDVSPPRLIDKASKALLSAGLRTVKMTNPDIRRRRERFERDLCLYGGFTYNVGRLRRDQPPYMPELRALYMAVRETHKGKRNGIGKGMTVNRQWPLCVGKARHRTVISRRVNTAHIAV